jgi:FtsH-binding integral membrane protein
MDKHILILKTIFMVIIQLMITYFIMTKTNIDMNWYVLYLTHLIIGLIIIFVPLPFYIKFILFTIFSFFSGIMYSKLKLSSTELRSVFIRTILLYFGLILLSIAMIYSNLILEATHGNIVFMAITGIFIFGLVTLFDPVIKYNQKAYAIAIIILFSIFIIYDTHYLLLRNTDNIIAGAIDYYLDVVNISVQLSFLMYHKTFS